MNVSQLESDIKIYSKLYYEGLDYIKIKNKIFTKISDKKFDELIDKLKSLNPSSPILTTPGWGYELSSDKEGVAHETYPVKGISYKNKDKNCLFDIFDFYKESNSIEICGTPKLDGCSIILTYKNSHLIRALTRGDGFIGSNIMDIIHQLPSIPKKLSTPTDLITIRGELINIKYLDNIRNLSNGLVMRKNYTLSQDELESFVFIPYSILSNTLSDYSIEDELKYFSDNGFISIPYLKFNSKTKDKWIKDYDKNMEYLSSITINSIEYKLPIDGIVFSPNIPREDMKEGTIYARDLYAYKLDSDSEVTEVVDIVWNLTRLGRYIPLIVVNTVTLNGANVSNITGSAYQTLIDSGIGIGSKVRVVRSGGVIPYITEVITKSSKINAPTKNVKIEGAHLFTTDPIFDDESIIHNIYNDFKEKGFGDSLYYKIKEVLPDFFSNLISFRKYIDYYGNKSKWDKFMISLSGDFTDHEIQGIEYLVDYIYNYKVKMYEILWYANIDGLGDVQSYNLYEEYFDFETLIKDIKKPYGKSSIDEIVNSRVATSLRNQVESISKLAKFFHKNGYDSKEVEQEATKDSDKPQVVLTNFGGSSLKKSEFESVYSDKLSFTDDVNSADLVIYSKPGSSKYNLAVELGIPVIQVEDYIKDNPYE